MSNREKRRDPTGDEKAERHKYGKVDHLDKTSEGRWSMLYQASRSIVASWLHKMACLAGIASPWTHIHKHSHTSAFVCSFLWFRHSHTHNTTLNTDMSKLLSGSTYMTNTYELTHSTTIFFHRFLVPTIFTMHVFLGFFWRAPCSSGNKQSKFILEPICDFGGW